MYSLTYISAGTQIFSREQLERLATQAGDDNALLKVTGILLYRDGSFMQVLEGEKTRVLTLYTKIAADPRHTRVTTMLQGTVIGREFPRWAMGFQYLDRCVSSNLTECTEDLRAIIETNRLMATPSQAVKLIGVFAGLKE